MTVWLGEPEEAAVKSKPTPCKGIDVPEGNASLLTVKLPVCGPAPRGEKTTVAVQLACAARVAGQALLPTLKGNVAVSFMLVRLAPPVGLVRVTVMGSLVAPRPVTGKFKIPGWV